MKNIDEFIIQTQGIISEVTSDYFSIRVIYTLKLKHLYFKTETHFHILLFEFIFIFLT